MMQIAADPSFGNRAGTHQIAPDRQTSTMVVMFEEWLTVQQAAELSGYHAVYLRNLIRDGKLAARKFGPVWQVSRKALQTFIKEAGKSGDKRRGPKG